MQSDNVDTILVLVNGTGDDDDGFIKLLKGRGIKVWSKDRFRGVSERCPESTRLRLLSFENVGVDVSGEYALRLISYLSRDRESCGSL
jgi:hypothetical protein